MKKCTIVCLMVFAWNMSLVTDIDASCTSCKKNQPTEEKQQPLRRRLADTITGKIKQVINSIRPGTLEEDQQGEVAQTPAPCVCENEQCANCETEQQEAQQAEKRDAGQDAQQAAQEEVCVDSQECPEVTQSNDENNEQKSARGKAMRRRALARSEKKRGGTATTTTTAPSVSTEVTQVTGLVGGIVADAETIATDVEAVEGIAGGNLLEEVLEEVITLAKRS